MPFGRSSMLSLWPLDPVATYLNHGTVGVTPCQVLEAQRHWRDRIERHPSKFMLRELWSLTGTTADGPTLMRQAAAEVAAFVGARPDDLVFVDNTTTGVNAVVNSLPLAEGDEIVITDHAYGGIANAIRHATRRARAHLVVATLPYPKFDPAVASDRIATAITSRTKLVIVEHIAAESALIFPVREIVTVCHARGVPVLVDGAHVPGQLDLDVDAIGADIYVGNLHKWAMAPRSCAFMTVAPALQPTIHPQVISWGYEAGFTHEFDLVGTRDPTPWLSAPDGIRFLQSLGFAELRRYNHDLVWQAAQHLTNRWQTPLEIDESMAGCMVSVMAPEACGTTLPEAIDLRQRLLLDHNIEVQVHPRAGRLWVRVSTQVYNEMADIERLGAAVETYSMTQVAPNR
jgi:isopenicillin-N epimerase